MVAPPFRRRASLGQAEDVAEVLRRQGAIVTVQVQVPSALAAQIQGQGQGLPPPQVVRGIVDTGASISTVSDQVAQAAGLKQVGSVPLYGVGGGGERPVYAASFGLPDYGIVVDPIEVGGVTIGMPGVDILIGRDLLKAVELAYAGPRGIFSLTTGGAAPTTAPGPFGVPGAPAEGMPTEAWIGIGIGAAAVIAAALVALDVI